MRISETPNIDPGSYVRQTTKLLYRVHKKSRRMSLGRCWKWALEKTVNAKFGE
jgi:hypothetical protein